ncbi:uncharacterized protein LOC135653214 isoform X2 [Musa acuminata AAA Group]|uniref:uncharacterized protein LOC103972577 isoform X2 n=1 Tax=Musa acuminata AAA Group TaxID=214697 RepID=UPI0031CE8B04
MMDYQNNLDFYLTMSRKELQKLCKQHDLPANRSHAQLADSLKRNASSAALLENSINSMDGSSRKSLVSEPKANSSKVDTHGLSSGFNEIRGDERPFYHTGNQIDVIDHMVNPTSGKTVTNALCPSWPANSNGTESIGYSTFEHCNKGVKSCVAADMKETRTTQILGLECKKTNIRSEFENLVRPRNEEQKQIHDAIRDTKTRNTVPMPCELYKLHEYSMESGFVSSDEISTRTPTLQFFVMSEGGINLYVDLNSGPLGWINSMKDEMCVHQNAKHETRTLSKDISDSPEVDNHIKILPIDDTGMDLQGIEVEQNTGCTNSSSSSVVSENCNSEAYPPNTTVVTSGFSILTSGSVPVCLSVCLEENQVVSSSCAAYSAQNHLAFDTAPCAREGMLLTQDSFDASFTMLKGNASPPNASMRSITNEDDGGIYPVTNDGSTPKTACVDFVDVEVKALCNTLNDVPDKNNLPMFKDMQDSVDTYHSGHLRNHTGTCEGSFICCTNELPDNVCSHGGLSNYCQLTGQRLLDGPMADAQSEMRAANGLFYQQACSNYGTLVPKEPMPVFQDESITRYTMPCDAGPEHSSEGKGNLKNALESGPPQTILPRDLTA